MKRPRAPIACYRCHHKKVRCDGVHPNCTRCQSTGILCAYPSSRRSRNTQPTNVDPFIDNLSQLEALIRRIETDLESQRQLLRTVCASNADVTDHTSAEKSSSTLTTRMLKTEKDLQESRSIVAQLRLRGEQRAARGRRAAAAAAANASEKGTTYTGKRKSPPSSTDVSTPALNTGKHRGATKQSKHSIKKEVSPHSTADYNNNAENNHVSHYATTTTSPPFYFGTPNDFIHPASTYYFPTDLNSQNMSPSPMCNSNSSSMNPSFAVTGSFQDWSHLLGELPHSTVENGFVDPMILAAASDAYHQDHSIMANKARALSHLPPQPTLSLPGLQPSSSSTSTNSSGSYHYYEGYPMMGDEMMVDHN
ncbi:hypothetical protein K501DRAFT_293628 [Backusella circina FSU 941]|nr:hypothetical protein K501DRAFT_293628 [Backusella circina FSU 941]